MVAPPAIARNLFGGMKKGLATGRKSCPDAVLAQVELVGNRPSTLATLSEFMDLGDLFIRQFNFGSASGKRAGAWLLAASEAAEPFSTRVGAPVGARFNEWLGSGAVAFPPPELAPADVRAEIASSAGRLELRLVLPETLSTSEAGTPFAFLVSPGLGFGAVATEQRAVFADVRSLLWGKDFAAVGTRPWSWRRILPWSPRRLAPRHRSRLPSLDPKRFEVSHNHGLRPADGSPDLLQREPLPVELRLQFSAFGYFVGAAL